MKLKDLNDNSRFYTTKASDINRQLILAGIAIVWIFRNTTKEGVTIIKSSTILPLIFLCIAAILDLIQYVYGGWAWKDQLLKQEQQQKLNNVKDGDVVVPLKIPNITQRIYWCKICFTIIAYALLLIFLIRELGTK